MGTICNECKYNDFTVEIRGGITYQYPSCDYFHKWFKKAVKIEQCRDFEKYEQPSSTVLKD
jgi:hypothetical protein